LQESADVELKKVEAKLDTSDTDGMQSFHIDSSSFIETAIPISKLVPVRKHTKSVLNRDYFALVLDFCLDSESITKEM
jgi:hypothetical protein